MQVDCQNTRQAQLVNNLIFFLIQFCLFVLQVFEEESVVRFSNTSSNFEELCLSVVIRFHHPLTLLPFSKLSPHKSSLSLQTSFPTTTKGHPSKIDFN
ncbi:hypothetical protein M9H77_02457 [Catharanthus roseus]|uniref:Uncharacterized protein n=1 Tax=Catharanthus roseus TaxID=4058 RepID=A0ACC0C8E4_CATRO|nr:hypothetical protein M9H77_02457 [Catharanthus roseus]